MLILIAALTLAAGTPQVPADAPLVCRKVTTPDSGPKPFEMCLTAEQWAAKKIADAKDPNRKVCRYEEAPGTRLKSFKVCQTAAEWENQRQIERQAIERIQGTSCVGGAGC